MDFEVKVSISAPELATAIHHLAQALGGGVKPVVSEPVQAKEETAAAADPQPVQEPPKAKTITLEAVREKLKDLKRAGKPVNDLIKSYGVKSLLDIPPDSYEELLARAEAL